MTEIDYAAAFDEMNTLNELFAHHDNLALPRLNPNRFKVVEKKGGVEGSVVIKGLQSGFHYLSDRTSVGSNGFGFISYTAFRRVEPKERIVIDWVRPDTATA